MAKKITQTDIPDDSEFDDSGELYADELISKSQRKRDAEAAQQLGKDLLTLAPDALQSIELPENLVKALDEARRIRKHGALKRQLQYIGKLMRHIDLEPIREEYIKLTNHYGQDIKELDRKSVVQGKSEDGGGGSRKRRKEKRGRKAISGISDVFSKLISDDKIVPFDDDKELEDYTAKDWEELIQANLEEKANQVRRETPKQFFQSLPQELQIAAKYVADGGKDLKGLFTTLGQVEETKTIDVKSVSGQERIIKEYLSATGYGTAEDIQEEIEIWKDLGKDRKSVVQGKSVDLGGRGIIKKKKNDTE